jgi:hypothetical protein
MVPIIVHHELEEHSDAYANFGPGPQVEMRIARLVAVSA